MCLITKDQTLQKAKEDICCYKILLRCENDPKRIVTPFMRTPIILDQLTIAKGTPEITKRFEDSTQLFVISEGVIHCFEDLDQAIKHKNLLRLNQSYLCTWQIIIARAIIQKGTLYATGINKDICATEVFITNDIVSRS